MAQEKYILGEHVDEIVRLRYQHDAIEAVMGGKLIRPPIDTNNSGLRILDVATADGYFLERLAKTMPNAAEHHFYGNDIMESYVTANPDLPPNFKLFVHDNALPWPSELIGSFDLVHQRLGLFGVANRLGFDAAVSGLADLCKPGGYIQLIEADHNGPNSQPGQVLEEAIGLLRQLLTMGGASATYSTELYKWCQANPNLEEVHQEIIEMPMGAACATEELKEKSTVSFCSACTGLVQAAKNAKAKGAPLTMSDEELDGLVGRLETNLRTKGAYHRLFLVWARRKH